MKHIFAAILFSPLLLLPRWAGAEVRLPAIFGDHMVLQRDMELPVWGWAEPGEEIQVSIGDDEASTAANENGQWRVTLPALKASSEPMEMTVTGKNRIVLRDVLVGDVWLCAGQSNMERTVLQAHNAKEALAGADFPQIRFFQVKRKISFDPQDDCEGRWVVCAPGSPELKEFSAVAYFFGKEIHETQGLPVGLIGAYRGGSPAEAWTSLSGLQSASVFQHYADDFEHTHGHLSELLDTYQNETLPDWTRAMKEWNAKPEPKGPKPRWPLSPVANPRQPVVLFNGMIHPLIPFGIKGVIWYQGENNGQSTERAQEYAVLFPAMIADWRSRWGQGDFPFLYVQLTSYQTKKSENDWPTLRDSQLRSLSVPNTAMAVTIDIGEQYDAHPKNKVDVGQRLALAARHLAYGEDIVYSGPIFQSMQIEDSKVFLTFDDVGGGLVIGAPPPIRVGQKSLEPADSLQGFEVAGADGKFVSAQASIEGDTVVVEAPSIPEPVAVRYAWAAWPDPLPNLYNAEGLPASPFNTLTR